MCVLKELVDIIRDDDPQTLQPNVAAVARKVNDGVGTCKWRHDLRWGGGDRLVQQMVIDSPVGEPGRLGAYVLRRGMLAGEACEVE